MFGIEKQKQTGCSTWSFIYSLGKDQGWHSLEKSRKHEGGTGKVIKRPTWRCVISGDGQEADDAGVVICSRGRQPCRFSQLGGSRGGQPWEVGLRRAQTYFRALSAEYSDCSSIIDCLLCTLLLQHIFYSLPRKILQTGSY